MTPANLLNPSCGEVPVPEDLREIAAALRAGRVSLRMFPYFAWRYGERGRKFTRSDSAWLAWLARHEQDYIHGQILWLGSVLANRGMPRWLLETHLRVLHRQLCRAVPEEGEKYGKLLREAEQLRGLREEIVSQAAAEKLAGRFAAACGGEPERLLRGTGRLVAAAVADQRAGVKHAVARLRDWLVDVEGLRAIEGLRATLSEKQRRRLDGEGFARTWREAVDATIAGAEKA